MVFTIPEGLHADLNPLAWMVGTWRGKGRGEYPTIPAFEYAQEVVFNHDGRNFLNFFLDPGLLMLKVKLLVPRPLRLVSGALSPTMF